MSVLENFHGGNAGSNPAGDAIKICIGANPDRSYSHRSGQSCRSGGAAAAFGQREPVLAATRKAGASPELFSTGGSLTMLIQKSSMLFTMASNASSCTGLLR